LGVRIPLILKPISAVTHVSKTFPKIWTYIEKTAAVRFGKYKHRTPDDVFLPVCEYAAILQRYYGMSEEEATILFTSAAALTAVCAWNYTRQVYQINPDIAEELLKTPFDSNIPVQVLSNFPNFSIYIDIKLTCDDINISGVWVCMVTSNVDMASKSLLFVVDVMDDKYSDLEPMVIPLKENVNIHEAIALAYDEMKAGGPEAPAFCCIPDAHNRLLSKLINVVLYICSTNCDVIDKSPSVMINPFGKKWKKSGKFQLLPAMRHKYFSVGDNFSKQIQESQREAKASTNPIRPHVRRAHWHGFWTGPKTGVRDFILKWIPPTLVGTHNGYVDNVMI